MSEFSQEELNKIMQDYQTRANEIDGVEEVSSSGVRAAEEPESSGKIGEFVSEHSSENTKYTGPMAIVSYEGPKAQSEEEGNKNTVMQTNPSEPVGKVLYANNATYEGGFRQDMLHGFGVMRDPMGSVYRYVISED